MIKFRNHFVLVKSIILISIFIDIYLQYSSNLFIMILLYIFSVAIAITDFLRSGKLKNHVKYTYISFFFSICASSMLQYIVIGASTNIYQYCPIFEFFKFEKNILRIFILIHFSLYLLHFFITPLNIQSSNINMSFFLTFSLMLLFYFSIVGMLYNKKKLEIEKEEVKQLNEKLKLANIKLQEYSLEIEEAATSRERTRVSQELHDSLGHSLMALVMHLEFAKKIYNTNPQKVEEVLSQSEKIAKVSICDLRKAVTLLNSELEIKCFNNSIKKLINNFYLFNNIKIIYNTNKDIDYLSSNIKTSIYKIIQESMTNSLKHGKASEINIKVSANISNVELIITDNGVGCNNIIKSNGLNGIENRLNLLRGTICYLNHGDSGFGIKVLIPI